MENCLSWLKSPTTACGATTAPAPRGAAAKRAVRGRSGGMDSAGEVQPSADPSTRRSLGREAEDGARRRTKSVVRRSRPVGGRATRPGRTGRSRPLAPHAASRSMGQDVPDEDSTARRPRPSAHPAPLTGRAASRDARIDEKINDLTSRSRRRRAKILSREAKSARPEVVRVGGPPTREGW